MFKSFRMGAVLVVLCLGMAACGHTSNGVPPVAVDASGVPPAQQPQQQGYSGLDMAGAALAGGVVGHLLSGSGGGGSGGSTVNHTTVIQQNQTTIVHPAPAPVPVYRPPVRSYTPSRSYSSGRRGR